MKKKEAKLYATEVNLYVLNRQLDDSRKNFQKLYQEKLVAVQGALLDFYSEIKEYDIIAFERGKLLVTHRVVQVLKDGLVTKGDNNDLDDGITTTEKNYVGKSVFSIPLLGYAISWVQTRAARRSAIVSLFIVLGIQLFITKYLTN